MRNLNLLFVLLILFTLKATSQHLKGTVLTKENQPVSNAKVTIKEANAFTETDKNGLFLLFVPKGTYQLLVSASGFDDQLQKIEIGDNDTSIQIKLDFTSKVMDEVVVTGSKNLVSKNYLPVNVTVVGKEQIEQSGESALLPAIMHHIPGMFVTQRGVTGFGIAAGAAGAISMRGISSSPNNRVLVLLNGSPQFMGIFGHPLPDCYLASDVEKVEVIQGAGSVLYGTNAMGGVINIITKEQLKDGYTVNAGLLYGSYNTQKYMISAGYRKKRFSLSGSFNHDNTDGHRPNAAFKLNNGFIKAKLDVSKHISLSVENSLEKFNAADPGPAGGAKGEKIDIVRGASYLTIANKYANTGGNLQLFVNYGKHKITDGFRSRDANYGASLYQYFPLFKGNVTTAGVDIKNYGGKASNIFAMNGQGIVFGDKNITEWAPYIYSQQKLNKLVISAGFRWEHNSVYGNIPVPAGGLSYLLNSTVTLKAAVSKGFRSPTMMELYLFAPANSELKPEKMMNYEAGLLLNILKNKLRFDLTLFNVKGANLIQAVFLNGAPKNVNTGAFNNTGIEFAGKLSINEHFNLAINYSFINLKEKLIAAPKNHLELNADYSIKKFLFAVNLSAIQGLYRQVTPTAVTSSYVLLNAKAGYSINKFAAVFLKAENLTNQSYEINYGYPMPGTLIFGGINFKLQGNAK